MRDRETGSIEKRTFKKEIISASKEKDRKKDRKKDKKEKTANIMINDKGVSKETKTGIL